MALRVAIGEKYPEDSASKSSELEVAMHDFRFALNGCETMTR
jgi:hypothetical protein